MGPCHRHQAPVDREFTLQGLGDLKGGGKYREALRALDERSHAQHTRRLNRNRLVVPSDHLDLRNFGNSDATPQNFNAPQFFRRIDSRIMIYDMISPGPTSTPNRFACSIVCFVSGRGGSRKVMMPRNRHRLSSLSIRAMASERIPRVPSSCT